MKQWFKNTAAITNAEASLLLDVYRVEPAKTLLVNDGAIFYQLKQLVSVTPEDYQYFYVDLINTVAVFLQRLPATQVATSNQVRGLIALTLQRMTAILKFRRAYMLPAGADTETCYKEQDVWTYALFTAGLLKDLWQVGALFQVDYSTDAQTFTAWRPETVQAMPGRFYRYRLEENIHHAVASSNFALVQSCLPVAGWNWLQSFPHLFQEWQQLMSHQSLNGSLLAKIIQAAEKACMSDKSVEINESIKPEIVKNNTEANANNRPLADQFIDWLNELLKNKAISWNNPDDYIHHVSEGILIVIPDLIEKFSNEQLKIEKPLQINELTRTQKFIPVDKNNFIHRYYKGQWEDRLIIKGLLISPEHLAEGIELLSCNLSLQPDITLT